MYISVCIENCACMDTYICIFSVLIAISTSISISLSTSASDRGEIEAIRMRYSNKLNFKDNFKNFLNVLRK